MKKKNWDYFIKNINIEDVDMLNKADNLYGASQISEHIYDVIANNPELENKIVEKVISLIENYEDDIKYCMGQFEQWYDDEDLERFDYGDALYNCDDIYLEAIGEIMDIDVENLKYYGESE